MAALHCVYHRIITLHISVVGSALQSAAWLVGRHGFGGGLFAPPRRGDYGTFRLFSSDQASEGLSERLFAYTHDLVTNQSPHCVLCSLGRVYGTLLVLVSAAQSAASTRQRLRRRVRRRWQLSAAETPQSCWLPCTHFICLYSTVGKLALERGAAIRHPHAFWMQPNAVYFVWVGFGFDAIVTSRAQPYELVIKLAAPYFWWRLAVALRLRN